MKAYLNKTKSPVVLYVREKEGQAVSVEVKPGCFWECPLECSLLNEEILVKRGVLKVLK